MKIEPVEALFLFAKITIYIMKESVADKSVTDMHEYTGLRSLKNRQQYHGHA